MSSMSLMMWSCCSTWRHPYVSHVFNLYHSFFGVLCKLADRIITQYPYNFRHVYDVISGQEQRCVCWFSPIYVKWYYLWRWAERHYWIMCSVDSYVFPKRNLTHWGRDKMDAISQTTFSNAFSWIEMYEFRLRFHRSLFLRLELIIFQH